MRRTAHECTTLDDSLTVEAAVITALWSCVEMCQTDALRGLNNDSAGQRDVAEHSLC